MSDGHDDEHEADVVNVLDETRRLTRQTESTLDL